VFRFEGLLSVVDNVLLKGDVIENNGAQHEIEIRQTPGRLFEIEEDGRGGMAAKEGQRA
jgi:hypothetical protein